MYGLISFILYSASLLIGHEDENSNHMLVLVKAGLLFVSAFFYLISCRKSSSEQAKESYSLLSFVILIYEILVFLAAGRTILYIKDYPAISNSVIWIFSSIFSLIRFRDSFINYWKRIMQDRQTIKLIGSATLIAACIILLSFEPTGIKFTWDSEVIYQYIYGLDYDSIYDAKLLTYNCHVSIVYAQLLVILKLVLGNIRSAYFVLNSLCTLCASLGMTFLLSKILPNRRVIDYSLGNALFMFSPWVCGLSTLNLYDYYIWCLFPLMLYYASNKKQIGYLVIGIMIAFSKAPGLVVFGSVCAGILLEDIISKAKTHNSVKDITKAILSDIKYWYYLAVAAVFTVYILKAGIEGVLRGNDKSFGFDIEHIICELKVFYLTNFIWLFVILSLLCAIKVFIVSKDTLSSASKSVVFILVISDMIFVFFNLISITFHLPRYMDSHISVVYILSAIFLLAICKDTIRYLLLSVLCVLNLVSAFHTIDPVSMFIFKTINIGDHRVIDFDTPGSSSLSDSIIYNREHYSYQALLDKTLSYAVNEMSSNDEIMFSLGLDSLTWGFSGGRYSYAYSNDKHYFDMFYDNEIHGLANGYYYEYYSLPGMIPFKMHYIFPDETIDDALSISNAKNYYYIYMPTLNAGKEGKIHREYTVLDEQSFVFRGWYMNCIKFTR